MTHKSAPISVIIPAHNEERFIGEAIRNVQKQSLAVSELVVIADACEDRTAEIAAGLGAKVIELRRRNMAAALNCGIQASTQPWIAFLDADDFWHQEKIELQWKAIKSFPDVGLLACDCYTFIDGEIFESDQRGKQRWTGLPHLISTRTCQYVSAVTEDFFTRFYLQTSRVIVRRDAIKTVGPLDESFIFWQTIEFFSRILRHYSLAFVEKPLVYQRLHDANHSRDYEGSWRAYLAMTERMLKKPNLYPPGAGKAYRECLKRQFHDREREFATRQLRIKRLENVDLIDEQA